MGRPTILFSALLAWLVAGPISDRAAFGQEDAKEGAKEPTLSKKLAELNVISGTDAARGALKELLENKEEARRLLIEALTLTKEKDAPLSYNAAHILARTAVGLKDVKAAEHFYRICMDQANRLLSPQKLLESYGELIDIYYDHKMYAKSAALCRELLEHKGDDKKERWILEVVPTPFGEPSFEKHNGYDFVAPFRPAVHRLLIQALAKQGKYEQALKMIDTLIEARDHWREHQLRAWVLREAGQYAESAKTYENVIEQIQKDRRLDPEERDLYEERNRYILSNVYVDLRKIDKATEQLQSLIKSKPDDPGYHNDLGYIWADNDMNLEEAEKLVRRALELDRKRRQENPDLSKDQDRDNGAYLDSMGWVLHKRGKNKEALEYLLKAIEDKNAQHIEIYDHLGDVYMALGNRDKAVEAWRQGLKVVGEGRREAQRREVVERKLEKHAK